MGTSATAAERLALALVALGLGLLCIVAWIVAGLAGALLAVGCYLTLLGVALFGASNLWQLLGLGLLALRKPTSERRVTSRGRALHRALLGRRGAPGPSEVKRP